MARRPWTREETLVAFNLYCKTPFGRLHARNPDIIATAEALERTPSALAMKCCNIAALDPAHQARGVRGLSKVSALDREIWDAFQSEPEEVGFASEVSAARLKREQPAQEITVNWEDIEGLDREALVKVRVNQSLFRSIILAGYRNACAVCTLPIRALLVASHIVPWSIDKSARMNPRNGICLCSLHDRAFDAGILGISVDYTIHIADSVRTLPSNLAVDQSLLAFDGNSMNLPDRWHPSSEFLGKRP